MPLCILFAFCRCVLASIIPAIPATLTADMVQFYCHAFILSQQLAYLYGWPSISEEDEVDDETKFRVTMLIGGMLGIKEARRAITLIANKFAEQAAKRIPRIALMKTAWYPLIRTTARVGGD